MNIKVILKRIVFFAILLGIWEGLNQLNIHFNIEFLTSFFPGVVDVASSLYNGFFSDNPFLFYATVTSVQRLIIGFGIALIAGTLLGMLLATSKTADETLGSLIIALQSIPAIVWLPLAIMVIGLNNYAIMFVIILGGTWSMTLNTRMGFKNVQPLLHRAARTMGYTGIDLFRKVTFPASVPYALTGARLAWAFCWRALLAAELIAPGGLGSALFYASDYFHMDRVIAIMVIIGVIGMIMDQLVFNRIEKRVMRRWGLEDR